MPHHTTMLAFFGLPGWAEIIIIAFAGLLLFGKRLPEVARSIGQSIVEFKKGMAGVKDEISNAANTPVNPPQNTVAEQSSPEALPTAATPATDAPKNQTAE